MGARQKRAKFFLLFLVLEFYESLHDGSSVITMTLQLQSQVVKAGQSA